MEISVSPFTVSVSNRSDVSRILCLINFLKTYAELDRIARNG